MIHTIPSTTLIIGLGDPKIPNDSLVPCAIEKADELFAAIFPNTAFRHANRGGFDLLDELETFLEVLIIDRIATGALPPGSIRELPLDGLSHVNQPRLVNMHNVTLARVLDIGRLCGLRMPSAVHILGLEADETGIPAGERYDRTVESIVEYIEWFLHQRFSACVHAMLGMPQHHALPASCSCT